MLIAVDYPSLLGATAPASNNGSLEVKGWEVSLAWRDKVNDFPIVFVVIFLILAIRLLIWVDFPDCARA